MTQAFLCPCVFLEVELIYKSRVCMSKSSEGGVGSSASLMPGSCYMLGWDLWQKFSNYCAGP
jgi:hypothetical protein